MAFSYAKIGIDLSGSDISETILIQEFLQLLDQKKGSITQVPYIQIYHTDRSIQEKIRKSAFATHISSVELPLAVTPHDLPLEVLREKQNSTLITSLKDLKNGIIQALITVSNTGALIVAATHILGRMASVRHPPLLLELPVMREEVSKVILDVGAFPEMSQEDSLIYMFLGSYYASIMYGSQILPSVGLLNMGSESIKGSKALRHINQSMRDIQGTLPFQFAGNIEPEDIFSPTSPITVIVTAGFSGNIFLKTAEALIKAFQTPQSLLQHRHAALVAGVNGLVYKCHGKTSGESLFQALFQANEAVSKNLVSQLQSHMQTTISNS